MNGFDAFGDQVGSGRVAKLNPPRLLDDDDLGLDIEPVETLGLNGEARGSYGRIDRPTSDMSGGLEGSLPRGEATVCCLLCCSPAVSKTNVQQHYQPQVDDDGFMPLQDDFIFGNDTGAGQQQSTPNEQAAATQRRTRKAKTLELDRTISLHNRDLNDWSANYLDRMHEQSRAKQAGKLAAQAKKNAEHWFFGSTLLGQGMRGSIDLLSTVQMLEMFTGVDILNPGKKRSREGDDSSVSNKRSRGEPSSDDIARGIEYGGGFQDDNMPMIDDDTVEQGREAPTPLDDRQLSSLFPWNQSAGSRQPGDALVTSTSFGGGGIQLNVAGRRGSRLTSASPLVGRGLGTPYIDTDGFQFGGSDIAMGGLAGDDEFELFGPAAQVDTQTAAQSQWQRVVLGAESANFLTFLQTAIDDADVARQNAAADDEEDEALKGSVDFETILPRESNSQIVAAQAFLHVLALGTKDLIKVTQDEHYGPINMRVAGAA